MTDFTIVYKRFYSKITDDMYMELDEAETDALLEELLINALPWFEFPRVNIENYDLLRRRFNIDLSNEEINIIATYMMLGWFDQQLASVEVARMKFSGSDFKFTSQANHMSKLKELRKEYERIGLHLQRLYKRRKIDNSGVLKSTFGSIMRTSVRKQSALKSCPCQDEDLIWEDFENNSWESMFEKNNEDSQNIPLLKEDQWESM